MQSCRHCNEPGVKGDYCSKFCQNTDWFCRRIACELEGADVKRVAGFCYRVDYDEDGFATAIVIEKDNEWKETFTQEDSDGLWSLPWSEPSQKRVAHFLEAYPVVYPDMPEEAKNLLEEIERVTLVLEQESHMHPYSNRSVWWVNNPRKILKWIPSREEAFITSFLSETTGISTVKVLEDFPSLTYPSRSSAPFPKGSAILMPVYDTTVSTLLRQMEQGDKKRNTIVHACCAALVELARIQRAVTFFQHGDFHFGNIFIDTNTPSPPLEEIGAPAFPAGRIVLGDFGRSTITYAIKRGGVVVRYRTVTAFKGSYQLPATEDASQLLLKAKQQVRDVDAVVRAFLSGTELPPDDLAGVRALIRPIASADDTLALAKEVWAFHK